MFVPIISSWLERAEALGDQPAFHEWIEGKVHTQSWRLHREACVRVARAMIAAGVRPGDRVAIWSNNSAAWLRSLYGAGLAGATIAPIYATSSTRQGLAILDNCRPSLLLVASDIHGDRILPQRERLGGIPVVLLDHPAGAAPSAVAGLSDWESFLRQGDGLPESAWRERVAAIRPDDPMALIYTSGTTGDSKGAIITQRNAWWRTQGMQQIMKFSPADSALLLLPLAHVAGLALACTPCVSGHSVWIGRGQQHALADLQTARPTLFFGVPRLWEKLEQGIRAKAAGASRGRRSLFQAALRACTEFEEAQLAGRAPGLGLTLLRQLGDRLVMAKVRAGLGLDRARLLITAGAPMTPTTERFLNACGLRLTDAYGLTETTGGMFWNRLLGYRPGTVGRSLAPESEVRIGSDGEVLLRGPEIFQGYWDRPAATAEAIRDGWFHTGDLGRVDADGFLTITGRKKELIVTSGGKKIAPVPIEMALERDPSIETAMVLGDNRKFIAALIVPKQELREGADAEEARKRVSAAVERVNAELGQVERVKKFALVPRPFRHDLEELTATNKLCRPRILDHFSAEVAAMFAEPTA